MLEHMYMYLQNQVLVVHDNVLLPKWVISFINELHKT